MAQVSMQLVKELRERTQAGLNDCRTALIEAEGDMEKAVELIQKKGLAKSVKRAGALTTEGVVLARVAPDRSSGVLAEVNIQTDFAARNADFLAFAERVIEVAATAPDGADLGSLPDPSGSGTIEQARQALVARLGENISLRRWSRLQIEGPGRVESYVHLGGKIGVLVGLEVSDAQAAGRAELAEFAEQTAMQIAAMAPLYLSADQVPAEVRARQTEIYAAQPDVQSKPEPARSKIVAGKLARWLKDVCLLEQQSVIETDRTVEELRARLAARLGCDLRVSGFLRYERGEGIEKPAGPDFAAEVAAQIAGT